ncbi:MAG TPA: hypothetical protein VGQ62_12455, partial [Chloroflexota bacterium]|nr:hypothetical protein [Chloroflexota bacterium]
MSTVWAALARSLSPVEDRPRVAADIESARYTTRSGVEYVVIHNLAGRAYARLDPREFDLLPLMDGRHSVKELVIAYYQRHGVLALSRVAGLVNLLATHGLLGQPRVDAYARLGERLRGRVAMKESVELTSDRVDALLGRAYQSWGRFLFHRLWLWFGIGLGVLGPLFVLGELARGRYALWDVGGSALMTIAVLVALALLALAVHELGHGLAVKHAGRYVHQAGLRLYFGLPAAYVDTSDIWMAAPRERLLTAFAGPWTGLVLGGICAIAATVLPTGPAGALLFTAGCVFLADNLFNFNPLLELDGYYMLIDYLDRPMLRSRALAFVRGPLWSRLIARQQLVGEERLLAAFGLAAVAYALLATALAIRAWQSVLVPLVLSNWQSGDIVRQVGAAVILLILAAVWVTVLTVLGRRLVRAAGGWLGWLGGRAAERRHRETLAALRAVPVWAELPAGRLLEVARAMRAQNAVRGEEIIRQGEAGDRFYLIGRGAVEVVVDGQPQTR